MKFELTINGVETMTQLEVAQTLNRVGRVLSIANAQPFAPTPLPIVIRDTMTKAIGNWRVVGK